MPDIRDEIDPEQRREFLNRAVELALEIRRMVRVKMQSGFQISQKSDQSVVTTVDTEIERLFRHEINGNYPFHGVIGEEFPPTNPNAEFQWIIDPIDGTEEFVHNIPVFGTVIGLYFKGKPLVGIIEHPALELCVSGAFGFGAFCNGKKINISDGKSDRIKRAERICIAPRSSFLKFVDQGFLFDRIARDFPNLRIFHSCYAYTCAILGSVDAMVEYHVHIWDLAASQILIEEAGGKYVSLPEFQSPAGDILYGAIFGRPGIVKKLVPYFHPC